MHTPLQLDCSTDSVRNKNWRPQAPTLALLPTHSPRLTINTLPYGIPLHTPFLFDDHNTRLSPSPQGWAGQFVADLGHRHSEILGYPRPLVAPRHCKQALAPPRALDSHRNSHPCTSRNFLGLQRVCQTNPEFGALLPCKCMAPRRAWANPLDAQRLPMSWLSDGILSLLLSVFD